MLAEESTLPESLLAPFIKVNRVCSDLKEFAGAHGVGPFPKSSMNKKGKSQKLSFFVEMAVNLPSVSFPHSSVGSSYFLFLLEKLLNEKGIYMAVHFLLIQSGEKSFLRLSSIFICLQFIKYVFTFAI